MQSFILDTIKFFVLRLIDARLYNEIESLVGELMLRDLPGEEKRRRVLEALRNLGHSLAPVVAATASWMLNLALETAVARIKASQS